jgi:hypothetical protein
VPEPVEERHLLLAVAADRVVGRQVRDQLADAGAELVREVRRRGPDERVDVFDRRLGHRAEAYRRRKVCQFSQNRTYSVWHWTCAESFTSSPQVPAR